ncbi:MAG: ribose-5-phosphate isomerase RpiA [Burkholderiales bacterium]|nr:ribose-5-phosphate isomerase RpiA [Burkholderiales bacterium]
MDATTQNARKLAAARAALRFVVPDAILGVGSGSTVNALISLLRTSELNIRGAVAASETSAAALRLAGIAVLDLNEIDNLPVYIDGADEVDADLCMIKGGGAALTREKILAHAATQFVCIVDESKCVTRLGAFALPLEVLPMAVALTLRSIERLGGTAQFRADVITDNGNRIIDARGLDFSNPSALESDLNQWPGVLCNGVFARRRADILVCAGASGIVVTGREAAQP